MGQYVTTTGSDRWGYLNEGSIQNRFPSFACDPSCISMLYRSLRIYSTEQKFRCTHTVNKLSVPDQVFLACPKYFYQMVHVHIRLSGIVELLRTLAQNNELQVQSPNLSIRGSSLVFLDHPSLPVPETTNPPTSPDYPWLTSVSCSSHSHASNFKISILIISTCMFIMSPLHHCLYMILSQYGSCNSTDEDLRIEMFGPRTWSLLFCATYELNNSW